MENIVSLAEERQRRTATVVVRPDAFRSKFIGLDPAVSAAGKASQIDGMEASPARHECSTVELAFVTPKDCDHGVPAIIPASRTANPASLADESNKHAHGAGWPLARVADLLRRSLSLMVSRTKRADPLTDALEAAKYTTLINRFQKLAELKENERNAIQSIGTSVRRTHQAGSVLVLEGEVARQPMFVVAGWACRVKLLPGGTRQIVGFILPGDGIGTTGRDDLPSVTTITALTTVETVDGSSLIRLAAQGSGFAGIAHATKQASLEDEDFLVNQIVRLGCSSISGRLAHLMLELRWRLARAGLAADQEFAMPLSHETLANAIGVHSAVVLKAMKSLQRSKLTKFRTGRALISRPDSLLQMSGFRPPPSCS